MKRKHLILAAGIFCAGCFVGAMFPKKVIGNFMAQEETRRWEFVTPEPAESHLKDKKKCWMCGNDDRSLIDLFRGSDDLGILCVNNWYVLAMNIRSLDKDGQPLPTSGMSLGMTTTGEGGCVFKTETNPDRGISQVTVEYRKNSNFDVEKVQDNLCQTCLNKLLEVMEVYGNKEDDLVPRDLCLIDFQTMELYSLQDFHITYFVRDYYVQIESGEEKQITAVYAPDINEE